MDNIEMNTCIACRDRLTVGNNKQLTSLGRYSIDIISIKVLQQFQVGYWDIASTLQDMKSQHIWFSWFSNLRYPPSNNISVKRWRSALSQGVNQSNNLYMSRTHRIFAYDVYEVPFLVPVPVIA